MSNNIDLAFEAQLKAEKDSFAIANESMPTPPEGYPPIKSIEGAGSLDSATVLGYIIGDLTETHDVINPDGKIIHPGDTGYHDAQMGRLKVIPMPKGYKIINRQARFLYAIVKGNPILLEKDAREAGYTKATATSHNHLRLTEIL